MDPDLRPLFAPESVAVIGASPDSWYSSNLVENCLKYGFDGDLHLVNPNREEAWGRPCYDSIDDVPATVDLVVVSVPREAVVGVVRSAAERGVSAALILTAGFAEADETGRALQEELADVARSHDVRICGPNCIGLMNAREGVVLTSTCSRQPRPGSIGLISQSGALAFTTFFERAADEDVHFARIVSTGNEADLTVADYVDDMVDVDAVDVICLYVEGADDPRRLLVATLEAVRDGMPVLAVKTGRSDLGERAALSHTGAITGSAEAWDGVFRQAGVERVPDIPDLLGRANAHADWDPPASNRVCVVSTSGGLASLLADMAAERGLALPTPGDRTQERLASIDELLTYESFGNPADIRGYGADALPAIADALFADDRFDAYVFAIALSAVDERAEAIARDLRGVIGRADDPVLALWTGRRDPGEDGAPHYERVREAGPLYADPGRCMDALASLVDARERTRRLRDRPAAPTHETPDEHPDVPSGRVLRWVEAERLLNAYGIDPIETRVVSSADEAAAAAADLGYPVVLKADSPAVPHRTDVGAVATDLDDPGAVGEAFERVLANARERAEEAPLDVLIQPQAEDGVEALAGVTTEPGFGRVVTAGAGGTLVETLADAAVLVPPFSAGDADDAIADTALDDLLSGSRSGTVYDRGALVDLLVDLGSVALDAPIEELDCNPVIVHESGYSIVDVLCRTAEDAAE